MLTIPTYLCLSRCRSKNGFLEYIILVLATRTFMFGLSMEAHLDEYLILCGVAWRGVAWGIDGGSLPCQTSRSHDDGDDGGNLELLPE